jgi:hypothetical protein
MYSIPFSFVLCNSYSLEIPKKAVANRNKSISEFGRRLWVDLARDSFCRGLELLASSRMAIGCLVVGDIGDQGLECEFGN